MCGGQEKMNEQDSGIEVVHGCLTVVPSFASPCKRSYKTSNEFLG